MTGAPPPAFSDQFPDYGTMIAALLQARDSSVRCTSYDIRALEFPAAIDAHDGYLISGSRHAAYDDLPWIQRLATFIRELDARQKPLVGICFGHQLIAQALGGRVQKAEQGWGIGVHHAGVGARAPWIDGHTTDYALVSSHQDQVVALPPRAELLAGSSFCPIAMYRIDKHVFALQGHPEFSREYSGALMNVRRSVLDPKLVEAGKHSLSEDVDSARVADWILAFSGRRPIAVPPETEFPLIEALLQPRAWPHPVHALQLIETHISWVILTGEYAYKIKKPVCFEFLDFSSLAKRLHFSNEELRINHRFAPELYLNVLPIVATVEGPSVAGEGEPIEWALRMRQFPVDAVLSDVIAHTAIDRAVWRRLGADLARLHATLPVAAVEGSDYLGTPGVVRDAAMQNIRQCRAYLREPADIAQLNALEESVWADYRSLEQFMWRRYESGRVRECHGDLHLRNIALIEGRAVMFDALEFNAAYRWIDVMNETRVPGHGLRKPRARWRGVHRAECLARAQWRLRRPAAAAFFPALSRDGARQGGAADRQAAGGGGQ